MTIAADQLPVTEIHEPADQAELTEVVRECSAAGTPIYPIGGGTSLDFGLPPKREGVGLSLARMNRIVDYPARDMTITVDAGVTMDQLAAEMAGQQQRLPIDVPQPQHATLGGVVATNWNGPRRYGQGTVRDHVIGISAVDGRGVAFKGGGRVVKNVAGYDFCKLLTGSLGTLGVITQLTLKLKPVPPALAVVACAAADPAAAEALLAALVQSQTVPVAIELLAGPAWEEDAALADLGPHSPQRAFLLVALEGTRVEVDWMVDRLLSEWREQGAAATRVFGGDEAEQWLRRLAEFPQAPDAPLVVRANVVPSGTTRFFAAARQLDEQASLAAHAGSGVIVMRFSEFPGDGLSKALVGNLDPVASSLHGNVIVLSNPSGAEMTHQSVWGGIDAPFSLMEAVKRQFDPHNLLNPGRFVYSF